jgi:uncharacterized RDD family membrane protein YckC
MSSSDAYYIVEAGERKGPLQLAELLSMREQGSLAEDTLVWKDGMADWQPARAVLPETPRVVAATYTIAQSGQRVLAGLIDICVVQAVILLFALLTAGFGTVVEVGFPLANAIYGGVMMSSVWQATVGKKLLGLKVVDLRGNKPSTGRIWGRSLASLLSWFPLFGIGYLFVFFTARRQTLHDMIAGTLVVKDEVR